MRENRVSSCRMIGRILPAMGMGIQSGQMPGKINPHHNGQIEGEHPPEQDRNAHTARCPEEHLEEHLKEIVNISGKDEKTLARRLEEHRREVHDRIATEHPELAERFKERRHVLDEHLKQRRPEVYELVVSLREKEETDLK